MFTQKPFPNYAEVVGTAHELAVASHVGQLSHGIRSSVTDDPLEFDCKVTRGVFLSNGRWHPIPYVEPSFPFAIRFCDFQGRGQPRVGNEACQAERRLMITSGNGDDVPAR